MKGIGTCDLTIANRDLPDDKQLKAYIEDASKFIHNSKMPTWKGLTKEEEYGPLMEYVRSLAVNKMAVDTKK